MTDPKLIWPVEPLSPAAQSRLIRGAMAGTQLLPWPQAVLGALERALSDWRYGMAYKLAGAAACVVFGLGLGVSLAAPTHDVTGLAFMSSAANSTVEIGE